MTDAGSAATLAAGPEPGALSRIIGVLFSPAKTFDSIARKPGWDWLVPIGLLLVLTVVAGILINPKLDTDAAIKSTMKRVEARGNLTDAQRDRTQAMVEKQFGFVKSKWILVLGTLTILVPLFFVSGVYLGIARAMGAGGRYGTLLAGYAFCQIPALIKGLIGVCVSLPRTSIELEEIDHLVKSNVGSFLDVETTGRALMTLMNSIDLFEIWGVVLGSIMLSRTTKLSRVGAAVAVVSVWALWVFLKFGATAIGAAFGG